MSFLHEGQPAAGVNTGLNNISSGIEDHEPHMEPDIGGSPQGSAVKVPNSPPQKYIDNGECIPPLDANPDFKRNLPEETKSGLPPPALNEPFTSNTPKKEIVKAGDDIMKPTLLDKQKTPDLFVDKGFIFEQSKEKQSEIKPAIDENSKSQPPQVEGSAINPVLVSPESSEKKNSSLVIVGDPERKDPPKEAFVQPENPMKAVFAPEETTPLDKGYIDDAEVLGSFDRDPSDNTFLIRQNPDGKLTDNKGRSVNRYGYLIDEKGNIINREGVIKLKKEDIAADFDEGSPQIMASPPKVDNLTKTPAEQEPINDVIKKMEEIQKENELESMEKITGERAQPPQQPASKLPEEIKAQPQIKEEEKVVTVPSEAKEVTPVEDFHMVNSNLAFFFLIFL